MGSFDTVASYYDHSHYIPERSLSKITECIARAVGISAQSKVLEIGVGTGRIAMPFVQKNIDYVGIDISAPMLEKFAEKFPTLPNHLTLLHGDATQMPFIAHSFSHVLAYHVFYFISDLGQVMKEIMRVLLPTGTFVHCDEVFVHCDWINELNMKWYELVSESNPVMEKLLAESNPLVSDKENAIRVIIENLEKLGYKVKLQSGTIWMNQIQRSDYVKYFENRKDNFLDIMPVEQAQEALVKWKEFVKKRWSGEEPRYARKQLNMIICQNELILK